ncbi:hypothetical protein GYMLUDRAFT_251259 [Collybiopsis luxurians FD-317 M1]|uniref:Uncharacterized protein n=1 Tax=Collybiopsis luxurians FD-317 M1 TaxID=944289 RepID=A0A0D0BD75_9AGAR|nr:hypothetical protein GYMLUDRAFT_251259 [Collybiopsis luxurians FD-317 M1]
MPIEHPIIDYVQNMTSSLDNGFLPSILDPIIGGPPAANTPAAVAEVKYDKPPEKEPKTEDIVNLANITEVSGFTKVRLMGVVNAVDVPLHFFVASYGGE